MNTKNLVILTCRKNFFGQTRKPWVSLDVDKICQILQDKGFEIEKYDFHEVINNGIDLKDKTILYSFSQKDNYREYIKDIIYYLGKKNHVVPSYDLLKCHENKGYQELYKKQLGIHGLSAGYYTSSEEVDQSTLSFPLILKTLDGSNGKGVYLLQNYKDFKDITKGLSKMFGLGKQIDLLRRRYFRKKKFKEYPGYSDQTDYREYKHHKKIERSFILQEFVPDLDCDYRVLVAIDRYYVIRRDIKEGDFRASGSKLFRFSDVPDVPLLNYAREIYRNFDSPFLSMDIVFDGKEHQLVEYQALHFGVNAIVKSKGYFAFANSNTWGFIEEKPVIENVFAKTFADYLNKKR